MSNYCREHRPLLCDEYSDEELDKTSSKFERRVRYSSSSGRAKTQAKGAAAILTRWPEHLSSILRYWWMGLGMIAVLIFVIYNSIVAIAILPPTHTRPAKIQNVEHKLLNGSQEITVLPSIFMHIFVSSNDDLNINDHLTYLEPFSKKYSSFKKNFVIVVNDVTDDIISISDEMRNEMALNTLWSDTRDVERQTIDKNITFKIISLTKYMDESPIKKYWRRLPNQFIEYLTRCIAIWDKGGIAFNPQILTSISPNPVYLDKIHTFLNKYVKFNKTRELYLKKTKKKNKKTVNNIRDIINNLEMDDNSNNQLQYNLSETENREIISTVRNDVGSGRDTDKNYTSQNNNNLQFLKNFNKSDLILFPKPHNNMTGKISKKVLLPTILKYLFHDPPKNVKRNISRNKKRAAKSNAKLKRHRNDDRTLKLASSAANNKVDNSRLMIDLKGNLVATDTSCHAFIGTVFSNAIHHSNEESLTDFIIKELSVFCKGILSSCNGVDVILL